MANHSVKGNTSLKSEDRPIASFEGALHLAVRDNKEVLNQGSKKLIANKIPKPPCDTKARVRRNIVDTSKFTVAQPLLPCPQKPMQVILPHCKTPSSTNIPSVQPQQPSVSESDTSPMSSTGPSTTPTSSNRLVVHRRAPLSSLVTRKPVERIIPLVSERTGKVIVRSQVPKIDDPSNGRICKYTPTLKHCIPASLTITPVEVTSTSIPTCIIESPGVICKVVQEKATTEKVSMCSRCGNCSRNPNKCDVCKHIFPTATTKTFYQLSRTPELKETEQQLTPMTPKSAVIPKQIFYSTKLTDPESGFASEMHYGLSNKVFIVADPQGLPKSRPRTRSRLVEPVCLTISSDEEEPMNEESTPGPSEIPSPNATLPPHPRSVLSPNIERTTENKIQPKGNETLEKNVFSQVTNPDAVFDQSKSPIEEEEEDEMLEEEEEEEEEDEEPPIEEPEDADELENKDSIAKSPKSRLAICCRSIRIGSFKIHPLESTFLPAYVTNDSFCFNVPTVTNQREIVPITLKVSDLEKVLGHFGRCLPILFINTNPLCGERIRKRLHMEKGDAQYFDPEEKDERQKRITFLIDVINDDQRSFLRHVFPGERLKEIDQKTANEILVKSTPNQNQLIKCQSVSLPYQSSTPIAQVQNTLQAPVIQPSPVKIGPSTPVTKILTYPPPPQTGGIAITSEDLVCLDDGEFLNDAIIDFYLKYLMNEKLSEVDRQRTHIFSSFFYPRLTQKPSGRTRAGEEGPSTMQVKRHGQVRTWTKHLDIFEKDFIIIPINQNVHWFLAIICYPGLVPDAPLHPPKVTAGNKSVESVTSSNDQESCESSVIDNGSNPSLGMVTPTRTVIRTKDQACNTDVFNQSSDENSPVSSCSLSFGVAESDDLDDPLPEAPDSSTHPDMHGPHKKLPCILIFDSLCGPSRWRIANTLREYLEMEWKIKKGSRRIFDRSTMQGFVPRVPQQTNFSDCGIYVLQYVESFFEHPLPYFASPMPQLQDWFPSEKVANKREQIKSLISELKLRPSSSNSSAVNVNKSGVVIKETGKVTTVSMPQLQTAKSDNS